MNIKAFDDYHLNRPTKWQRVKRNVVAWLERKFVCGLGIDERMIDDLDEEEQFQNEVLKHRIAPVVGVKDGLAHHIECVEKARERQCVEKYVQEEQGKVILFGDVPVAVGVTPDTTEGPVTCGKQVEANVVAPVVGAVLSAVDSKLGNALEHTEANRALVQKYALQVMRAANMRHSDISLHIAHVVECYFQSRENLAKAGLRRRRAPAWLLKSLGFKRSTVGRA